MEMLTKALDEMPKKFTSHEFYKTLEGMGYPTHQAVDRNRLREFLLGYCNHLSKFIWEKIPTRQQELSFNEPTMRELESIEYLKSRGYKIMKPQTEYVEL